MSLRCKMLVPHSGDCFFKAKPGRRPDWFLGKYRDAGQERRLDAIGRNLARGKIGFTWLVAMCNDPKCVGRAAVRLHDVESMMAEALA